MCAKLYASSPARPQQCSVLTVAQLTDPVLSLCSLISQTLLFVFYGVIYPPSPSLVLYL